MHQLVHAVECRDKVGPLYLASTERFEDLYGDCKRFFRKGTISTAKQMFQRFYTNQKKMHRCQGQRRLEFRTKTYEKTEDSWVWRRNTFYKVVDVRRQDHEQLLVCKKARTRAVSTADVGVDLPWSSVGVEELFSDNYLGQKHIIFSVKEAEGKAIILSEKYLMAWPKEWLMIF